jgi:hypothetical protein
MVEVRVVSPLNLLFGLISLGFAVAQALAAFDVLPLNSWPFVKTDERLVRLAMAVWMGLIGLVLVISAF